MICGKVAMALSHLDRAASDADRYGVTLQRLDALVGAAECERAMGRHAAALSRLREAENLWEGERRVPSDPDWRVQRGQLAEALCFDLANLVLADPASGDSTARVRAAYDLLQRFKARSLLERVSGPAGEALAGGRRNPLTLAQVQARVLAPRELLLDAFVGEHAGLLFAVTRDSVRLVRLPDTEMLATRIRVLRDLSRASAPSGERGDRALREAVHARAAHRLALDVLGGVADLVAGSRRVIVAADGPLIALPWESLPVSFVAGAPESALVATREVERVPSISLLAAIPVWLPTRGPGRSLLASATRGDGWELDAALAEAQWLAKRYRHAEVRIVNVHGGKPLTGVELSKYDVLHFSAHARVDDQRPWNSAVMIAAADSNGAHQGLSAASIAATPLDARLAVLSACESAGGRVVWGEGLEGLSAAFLAAGVPAVVATLWPVDDVASARFTRTLYQQLDRGRNVAEAMHDARRALLDGPSADDAAAFVLIGNGNVRVDLTKRAAEVPPFLIWLAIAAAVAGFVARMRRRHTGQPERPL
jgi:hypothetical protein